MNFKHTICSAIILSLCLFSASCSDDPDPVAPTPLTDDEIITRTFGDAIELENLANYANQNVPRYIRKNNSAAMPITDAGATLGRVLFYDKQLSVDNTISCASCHKQALAFGDDDRASVGVNGNTPRHSMRLLNVRFADEVQFFWDERAPSLEAQTTTPIQDHIEMGFSGEGGDPNLDDALAKIAALGYYQVLFNFVYGDSIVTEQRVQSALSQFVRSIQSFDSRYDEGRAQAAGELEPFTNFTALENLGKQLFVAPPALDTEGVRIAGGLACAGCHRAPEFDIDPEMQNNGVIATIAGTGTDLTVTRAPTLRNVVRADGTGNGGLMHTGDFDLDAVLDHYNRISDEGNTNLDNRLASMGNPQQLLLTPAEREAVIAFLKTLAGQDLYTNEIWSDPFGPMP